MDKKALQEQFEAVAAQNCWNINKYPSGWDGHGDDEYADDFVCGAWWGFQHQQAKVEELQQENLRLAYGNTSYYNQAVKQNEIIDELQKRVDFLEKHLKPCECGSKEISVDQEGYITKHCYRCGGIKTQEMIEQALKGEGNA